MRKVITLPQQQVQTTIPTTTNQLRTQQLGITMNWYKQKLTITRINNKVKEKIQ